MISAERGYQHIVERLLEYGANPNYDGTSDSARSVCHPLIYAIFNGHASCIIALLKAGADPNAISAFGTPLELSALRYNIEMRIKDVFYILFQHSKAPLHIRSVDEMKQQHTTDDIKTIMQNFRHMQQRISTVNKIANKTFHCISKRYQKSNNSKVQKPKKKTEISKNYLFIQC